ncbi:hypothetical protein K438DRAFT_1954312 [Mycena galopus ATCC 62051]|nr:hypothetical protein K438DRAFT_1954312 [Mycena galopus ATCC 62051]
MLAHLAADRALVVNLDTKILDLERSLFALRAEKQPIQERLNSFKYPVLTLPNEITAEIFTHFLPPYPDCPPFADTDSPTLLTQICHEWREIALGTPTLWRAMAPSDLSISSDRRAHLCETWLSRSGCCPLSVCFGDSNNKDRGVLKILSVLVRRRAHWEYLQLRLSSSHVRAIEGPTPLLRRLELTVLEDLGAIVTFSPAPLLCSLILCALTPLNVALPLGQMTSLSLDPVYCSVYVVILQQTRNLVHCELGIWDANLGAASGASDLPPDHEIELPWLESLTLTDGYIKDGPNPAGYLADFRAPALRSLQLDQPFLRPDPIDVLASFISKSGCTLQQVCFLYKDTLLAPFREAFPSIRFFCGDDFDTASISTNSSQL